MSQRIIGACTECMEEGVGIEWDDIHGFGYVCDPCWDRLAEEKERLWTNLF